MQAPPRLPPPLVEFLDEHFKVPDDLSRTHSLSAQLATECRDLERDLLDLTGKLSAAAAAWTARSTDIGAILRRFDRPSRDGNGESGMPPRARRILVDELPVLAKEVGQIETVRRYAETTLKLEVLVGDLEDATLSIMSQASRNSLLSSFSKSSKPADTRWKQEKLLVAVKAMKDIENVLVTVASSRPRWVHLLMAVDFRVDKALAILRPQALSDHRALLASLGWPPSLSVTNSEKDTYLEIPNPLLLMQGDKKEKYSQSFMTLCALQHFQTRWEVRQHDLLKCQNRYEMSNSADMDKKACLNYGLWTVDELVHPMVSRMEYHFSQWSNQPKFIFALVYKITRDFLSGVDNILQPLIDQARLIGYSAREAWVSSMIKMLSEYLARKEFPVLVRNYEDRDRNMEVIASWLHLVDLMITSDKRMQILADSGSPHMGPLQTFPPSLSVLSVFSEHPDWLRIWAEIEFKDAMDKLRSDLDDERSWSIDIRQQTEFSYPGEAESFLLSSREDYKAPLIADFVIRLSWAMIERALALLNRNMRIQFIRSSASLFLKHFFCILLQHCKEPDVTASVVEDNVLRKAAVSVNAARYCESVLREWSEDINFLEMSIEEDSFMGTADYNLHGYNSFFEGEIALLVKLETNFLDETMSGLLLQFESLCWDYIQNIKQWEVEWLTRDQILEEENLDVSPELIEALDTLKDQIEILKLNLNLKDFSDLWRSIATGLDYFIFSSIPMSDQKLSRQGINQFRVDIGAIFRVFRPFCARPDAFFPRTNDSLKLLTMNCKDSNHLLRVISKGKQKMEECLRFYGLFHLSADQAETILMKIEFGC